MEYLSRKGVTYVEKDVRADREALKELLEMGYSSTPVIVIDGEGLVGFDVAAIDRALALLRGRRYVVPQDVYDVGPEVLRHRILLGYEALAEGVEVETIVHRIMRTVIAPRVSPAQDDARVAIAS